MKKQIPTVALVIVFLLGLGLLLYPSVSDYWNSFHQSRTITNYAQTVASLDNELYDALWEDARDYNQWLFSTGHHLAISETEQAEYEAQLNVSGNGIMGYIEIPSIDCSLPIYHGTDEAILQIAIGHIAGSSLPVGGANTHCVLSGHRGLPSAKLFSQLDVLREGDLFYLRTLDETLSYEVDQILIVEPSDIDALAIQEGKDLCTLVTCTPYGVNTHRLLVRGHRVENEEMGIGIRITADAMQIEPAIVAPIVAVPMLLILLVVLMLSTRKPKKPKKK